MLDLLNPAMRKWLGVALAVIVADHLTKFWVSSALDYQEAIPVLPFFSLVLVHNTGAAFSFPGRCRRLAALVLRCGGRRRHRGHRAPAEAPRPRTPPGVSRWRWCSAGRSAT